MKNDTCSVGECDKPVKRASYCYGHYMKNWRYGTPTPNHPPRWSDLTGARFGTLTVVERGAGMWRCVCDCGAERLARAGDLNRYGDSNTCGTAGRHLSVIVGYGTAHERVRSTRGDAGCHRCVDCGKRATQWSYRHDDPDELTDRSMTGRPIAYSVNPAHYDARCVPCHKSFDLDRLDAAH